MGRSSRIRGQQRVTVHKSVVFETGSLGLGEAQCRRPQLLTG